jgi:uncharacterized protein YkwD
MDWNWDWNWVDLVLIAVVLLGALDGWVRGFLRATLELATLVASLLAAFAGYRWPADWLGAQFPALDVWAAPIAFVASFVLVHLLLALLVRGLLRGVPERAHGHGINRFLGLAPGAANGAINAVVVALLLLTVPLGETVHKEVRASALATQLAEPAETIESALAPIFDPAVRRTLQALTVQPESRASIPLRFRTTQATQRADLEARMLELVNGERARQGLAPLKADPELAAVARAHSRDMLARGYFSHVTPDGKDLGDRLRASHAFYLRAGENLAFAHSLPVAHQGLMNSPGHRANILRPEFGRLGIGILDAGARGIMVTQNFRN